MNTNDFITQRNYHIRIIETLCDHSVEWVGYLSLVIQENGEVSLDLTITNQGIVFESPDQTWEDNFPLFSIEFTENTIIQYPGDISATCGESKMDKYPHTNNQTQESFEEIVT
jgi:hypothetical protein